MLFPVHSEISEEMHFRTRPHRLPFSYCSFRREPAGNHTSNRINGLWRTSRTTSPDQRKRYRRQATANSFWQKDVRKRLKLTDPQNPANTSFRLTYFTIWLNVISTAVTV
jgi:hypothetical protein